MSKNNHGFMLVEVIITSTVILTGMVLMFSSYNSLFAKYKSRGEYHDIDTFYATKEMIDYLIENNLASFIQENLDQNESVALIDTSQCKFNNDFNNNFCEKLKNLYEIENMIFTTYDKQNLENFKNRKGYQ